MRLSTRRALASVPPSTVPQILRKRRVCPVEILAAFAAGDVVSLGLMTQEELDDPGKFDKRWKRWTRLPGREIAKTLIPLEQRYAAAKELMPFAHARAVARPEELAASMADVVDSAGRKSVSKVTVYVPENGRT